MRFLLIISTLLLIAGCSSVPKIDDDPKIDDKPKFGEGARIGSGDIADALTTYEILVNPAYVELNPLIPTSDPLLGVVVLIAMKYGGKAILIESGYEPEFANRAVDTVGWVAACHNLAIFASGGHPLGLLLGAGCGALYWN